MKRSLMGAVVLALCVLTIGGCKGPQKHQAEEPSKGPKTTYGQIMERAHGLQTPSAGQQDVDSQAADLADQ